MLRLLTLGGCFLERDGNRLESLSANRKGLALLALIAAAGSRGIARDSVVALLWPDSDDERARTSLRQLLHSLRTQLGESDLLLPSPELRLNPAVIESDVAQFRSALLSRDPATAVSLYRGPFLDGFFLKGSDEFERWVSDERAAIAREAGQALEAVATEAGHQGDWRAAVERWRELARLEPHSARAAMGLMRALDASGERTAALQHARVYELMMREEFGDAPDAGVIALAEELRRAPAPRQLQDIEPRAVQHDDEPATVQPATPTLRSGDAWLLAGAALLLVLLAFGAIRFWAAPNDKPVLSSIVVLPLANVGANPDDEFISDGLTENLITSLARVSDLRVIARTSAFAFKARSIDLRKLADSLGVDAVLEGSVQRVGQNLKVNVQLVNAADATVVWASTYDRQLNDILVVQDDITTSIVDALSARMRADAGKTSRPRVVADVGAYELYLRGRHLFTTSTDRETAARAQKYFQQALQRDSTIAEAHAGLSDVYTRLAIFGFAPPRPSYAAAKAAALRALELDPDLGEAYAALGHLKCVAELDWEGAVKDFERSIALTPNYTFGRMPYAICLTSMRRFRDALRQIETARAADPLSPAVPNMLGRVHVAMRQPDKAIEYLRQALELSPNMDMAYQQLGHAYLQKGMATEAIAALRRAAELSGARDSLHLAYAYATTGNPKEAQRIVDAISRTPARTRTLAYHLAMAYTGLRDFDRAFEWLQRGLSERVSFMVGTAVEPGFEPLHKDPRWHEIVKRMGLGLVTSNESASLP
jgi:TolB-like protein/DNA-binding SARP family transcriptional activator